MKQQLRSNHPGLTYLLELWTKYCPNITDWHRDWAQQHIASARRYRRGDFLYMDGDSQTNLYIVADGLIGRHHTDMETDKRILYSIATPGMGMMTRKHLYSTTPGYGDITVLRAQSLIIQIPFRSLKEYKERDPHIDTLIDVLSNKEKTQNTLLLQTIHGKTAFERCSAFYDADFPLFDSLYLQEVADLLQVSKGTVTAVKNYKLFGDKKKSQRLFLCNMLLHPEK